MAAQTSAAPIPLSNFIGVPPLSKSILELNLRSNREQVVVPVAGGRREIMVIQDRVDDPDPRIVAVHHVVHAEIPAVVVVLEGVLRVRLLLVKALVADERLELAP